MSSPSENEDHDLRARLRQLRVDPPPRDFGATLRQRLVEAGPPLPAPRWRRLHLPFDRAPRLAWPAAGIALGAAAFFALSLLQPKPERVAPATTVAAILPATKIAVVRINLSAELAVDSAWIRVTLPPELSFWADGRALPQRSFEWTQPLRSGDNEIPIAVRGQRPGRYRIAVNARIGDEQVQDEVLLEVVAG